MKPLPVPLDVLAMILFSFLGVLYGRRLHARGVRLSLKTDARQTGLLAVMGLASIAINFIFLTVKNFPLVVWHMPPVVEYYCVPAGWLMVIATVSLLFGAAAAMAFIQRSWTSWLVVLSSVAVLAVGEWAIQNSPWFKYPVVQQAKVDENGIIHQTHASTCAAAACANVARALGVDKTEREMIDLLGTTDDGTTPSQIIYGMRRLGFRCQKRRIADGDFTKLKAPAILFVKFGTEPLAHAVAYMGHQDGKAEIHNPQAGKQTPTREQLAQTWIGHAIEISKN